MWLLIHTGIWVNPEGPWSFWLLTVSSSGPYELTIYCLTHWNLFGTKPSHEPLLIYCQLDLQQHISMNLIWNLNIFFHENAIENTVCKMSAILFRPQCVNKLVTVFDFNRSPTVNAMKNSSGLWDFNILQLTRLLKFSFFYVTKIHDQYKFN